MPPFLLILPMIWSRYFLTYSPPSDVVRFRDFKQFSLNYSVPLHQCIRHKKYLEARQIPCFVVVKNYRIDPSSSKWGNGIIHYIRYICKQRVRGPTIRLFCSLAVLHSKDCSILSVMVVCCHIKQLPSF